MRKIKFVCDNNANIHSSREETYTLKQLGLTEEEWDEMSEEDRYKMVEDWAMERFEYWFEEV